MAFKDFEWDHPSRSYGRLFASSWLILITREEKDFFIFIVSSCQDGFPGEGQEWYHHNRNFTVGNVVVELF